jgi:hypothetical protein
MADFVALAFVLAKEPHAAKEINKRQNTSVSTSNDSDHTSGHI